MPQDPRRPKRRGRKCRRRNAADTSPARYTERRCHGSHERLTIASQSSRHPHQLSSAQVNFRTLTEHQSPIDPFHGQDNQLAGYGSTLSFDEVAALQMEDTLRKNWRADHLAGRILRGLISRKEVLDNDALDNLLLTANKVLFDGTLIGVSWHWSLDNDHRFNTELLGTTCTECSPESHGESGNLRIILSRPLLQKKRYHRDLLLSAFIHELIHCYLFIKCGPQHAEMCDGHTAGFKKIANVIERWIGDDRLHLSNMRARLEDFGLIDAVS